MDRLVNPYVTHTWVFERRMGAHASIRNPNIKSRFQSRKVLNAQYVKRLGRRS